MRTTSSRASWERLVAAVIKREQIWQLCHQDSITTVDSDFSTQRDQSLRSVHSSPSQLSLTKDFVVEGNNAIFCPEIEKNSLLIFKQSLKDPSNLLSSWDGEVNCCKWHGVIYNNSTGHVHELHLQGSSDQFPYQGLSGKLNPSLLDLKHLTYLDLSLNSFAQTIPPFLGSFVELEYLSLSNAGFHGKIPHVLGNLSSLHSLNLESNYGQLDVDSLEWLWGLSKLEYLNMNSVNLSRASNWAKVINTLPSLKELSLSDCSLEPIAPVHEVNTTSLLKDQRCQGITEVRH